MIPFECDPSLLLPSKKRTGCPVNLRMLHYSPGRSGGIGRRAGLKIRWGQLRAGSSPASGTMRAFTASRLIKLPALTLYIHH